MIAQTPPAPYYAVVFTSLRTEGDNDYGTTAGEMERLAREQPGYLGMESVRDGLGITVSCWSSLEAIRSWKANLDHLEAQRKGRKHWYSAYKLNKDHLLFGERWIPQKSAVTYGYQKVCSNIRLQPVIPASGAS